VKRAARARAVAGAAAAALAFAAVSARAGASDQFWPELDAYFVLSDRTRLFLLATGSVYDPPGGAGGTQFQDVQLGVHLDVTLAPLVRSDLRKAEWQRNRYLWMRIGYRYGRSLGSTEDSDPYRENRGIFELTGRSQPLAAGLELIGRFRWDARDVNDQYSNRYRLRLQVERAFDWDGRTVIPFANAETFYDTRFDTWNRQRYQLGAEFELNRSWRLEPSLYRQNDSRSQPSRVNALGLVLKYFR
jgi:hypothetical protein